MFSPRLIVVGGATVVGLVAGGGVALACAPTTPTTHTKVWVCKYVHKPGSTTEVLKAGKNPIVVDSSATIGTWFKDAQGQSYVAAVYVKGEAAPACPTTPTPSPTTSTDTPSPTTSTDTPSPTTSTATPPSVKAKASCVDGGATQVNIDVSNLAQGTLTAEAYVNSTFADAWQGLSNGSVTETLTGVQPGDHLQVNVVGALGTVFDGTLSACSTGTPTPTPTSTAVKITMKFGQSVCAPGSTTPTPATFTATATGPATLWWSNGDLSSTPGVSLPVGTTTLTGLPAPAAGASMTFTFRDGGPSGALIDTFTVTTPVCSTPTTTPSPTTSTPSPTTSTPTPTPTNKVVVSTGWGE